MRHHISSGKFAAITLVSSVWPFSSAVVQCGERVQAPPGWRHGVHSRSLGGTHVATLCNHNDKEGSIRVPGIDPSCDLRPNTQSLTSIENDLYQRKTAILIPRYSAVWVAVFDSSAQSTARRFGDTACHEENSNHPCRHRNRNLEQRPNGLVS